MKCWTHGEVACHQVGRTQPDSWTRRDALKLGVPAVLGAAAARPARDITSPRPSWGGAPSGPDPAVIIDGTRVRALALRALDAATAAGASYADVRLTRSLAQTCAPSGRPDLHAPGKFREDETLGVGVRVRVGGAWGFAASPYWDAEEVVKLAGEAVVEAKANAQGAPAAAWAPSPVASGHWVTPIKVDPFVLTLEEKLDFFGAHALLSRRYRGTEGSWGFLGWRREEQAVATSEGSYVTQALYVTGGEYSLSRRSVLRDGTEPGSAVAEGVWPGMAAGWEVFTDADIPGQIPALYEAAAPHRPTPRPVKVGEVGRYDVVFSASAMSALLARTLGVATQLDRALGLEANAGGTSYLGPDLLALLGSFQVAAPLVTMTANRSMPRGLATVKWDAEAVEPEDFTLIKDGVLVDYQTTRDRALLLAPWYQKRGKPVRSHGCADAESALFVTTQHMPNLVLEPGREALSFADLVADTKRGLAVFGGQITTDFQARTGSGGQLALREIVNGQLGAYVTGLDFLFSSPTFWKNVVALGGAASAVEGAGSHTKGQPAQSRAFTVRAVPALVKDVDFIDPLRRA